MPHGSEKFEAGKRDTVPDRNGSKLAAAKDRKGQTIAPADALAEPSKTPALAEKEKALLSPLFANMAKKPADLANYKLTNSKFESRNEGYRYEIGNDMIDKNDHESRSPENREFNKLFLEVQRLSVKKENALFMAGFIASKGEKVISGGWYNSEGDPGFKIKYGNEEVDTGGYLYIAPEDQNRAPAQRKQLYAKDTVILNKVAEILRRGFEFPAPKYMVVKSTADIKKHLGIALSHYDKRDNDSEFYDPRYIGEVPPNTLVKVVYTSTTGYCYVIAKNNDGTGSQREGFVDTKLLEPYNAAKFHPEVSPIRKAFVKKERATEQNKGLNVRDEKNLVIGKIPLGLEVPVLALKTSNTKTPLRVVVKFKDPSQKNKEIIGFVVATYLNVSE